MTLIWSWLDAHPGEVLTVMLFVGLMIAYFGGVFLGWWEGPTRFVADADDPQSEYADATHADDVYDQEAEPDRAVAALRAELADDVAVGRWLG